MKSKVFDRSISNTIFKSILDLIHCQKYFYNSGDGDRHVGIYASPDNWSTCYLFAYLLTLNWLIYKLLFTRQFALTDIHGLNVAAFFKRESMPHRRNVRMPRPHSIHTCVRITVLKLTLSLN